MRRTAGSLPGAARRQPGWAGGLVAIGLVTATALAMGAAGWLVAHLLIRLG